MSIRPAVFVVTVVVGAAAAIGAGRIGGSDEAEAVLPARLERSMVSEQLAQSVDIDVSDAREVVLDGDQPVFLVPGDDGDACIGLEDGSAACGPADSVARGRLLLIIVDGGGAPAPPIPANGSATAVVYGYQPDPRAVRASIVGADGRVLGSSTVVDGLWRIEIQTNSQSRRMTGIRFEAANESGPAPNPIDLDRPPQQL